MRRDTVAGNCLVTLVRTQTLVSSHFARRLRRHALSPAAFNALLLLNRSDCALSPHEIGDALAVTRGAVTLLIDSLESRGLVERRRHPGDRRMQLIELTPAGRELVARVGREHEEGERQLLGCLDQRERETLTRLLTKVQAHADAIGSASV